MRYFSKYPVPILLLSVTWEFRLLDDAIVIHSSSFSQKKKKKLGHQIVNTEMFSVIVHVLSHCLWRNCLCTSDGRTLELDFFLVSSVDYKLYYFSLFLLISDAVATWLKIMHFSHCRLTISCLTLCLLNAKAAVMLISCPLIMTCQRK